MYCKSNMNCTNMLLLYMLFNIFIMIGDRGGNNGQAIFKRRINGKFWLLLCIQL